MRHWEYFGRFRLISTIQHARDDVFALLVSKVVTRCWMRPASWFHRQRHLLHKIDCWVLSPRSHINVEAENWLCNTYNAHTIMTKLKETKFKMSKELKNTGHNDRDNLIKDTESNLGGLEDISQGRREAGGQSKLGSTWVCSRGKDFTFSCKVWQHWGNFTCEHVWYDHTKLSLWM